MPNKNEGNINPYSAKVIQLGFNISVSGDPDTDFQVVLDDNGRSCYNESQIQPSGVPQLQDLTPTVPKTEIENKTKTFNEVKDREFTRSSANCNKGAIDENSISASNESVSNNLELETSVSKELNLIDDIKNTMEHFEKFSDHIREIPRLKSCPVATSTPFSDKQNSKSESNLLYPERRPRRYSHVYNFNTRKEYSKSKTRQCHSDLFLRPLPGGNLYSGGINKRCDYDPVRIYGSVDSLTNPTDYKDPTVWKSMHNDDKFDFENAPAEGPLSILKKSESDCGDKSTSSADSVKDIRIYQNGGILIMQNFKDNFDTVEKKEISNFSAKLIENCNKLKEEIDSFTNIKEKSLGGNSSEESKSSGKMVQFDLFESDYQKKGDFSAREVTSSDGAKSKETLQGTPHNQDFLSMSTQENDSVVSNPPGMSPGASGKKLEWDSGADVGYLNLDLSKENLSTIERIVLKGLSSDGLSEKNVVYEKKGDEPSLKFVLERKATELMIEEIVEISNNKQEIGKSKGNGKIDNEMEKRKKVNQESELKEADYQKPDKKDDGEGFSGGTSKDVKDAESSPLRNKIPATKFSPSAKVCTKSIDSVDKSVYVDTLFNDENCKFSIGDNSQRQVKPFSKVRSSKISPKVKKLKKFSNQKTNITIPLREKIESIIDIAKNSKEKIEIASFKMAIPKKIYRNCNEKPEFNNLERSKEIEEIIIDQRFKIKQNVTDVKAVKENSQPSENFNNQTKHGRTKRSIFSSPNDTLLPNLRAKNLEEKKNACAFVDQIIQTKNSEVESIGIQAFSSGKSSVCNLPISGDANIEAFKEAKNTVNTSSKNIQAFGLNSSLPKQLAQLKETNSKEDRNTKSTQFFGGPINSLPNYHSQLMGKQVESCGRVLKALKAKKNLEAEIINLCNENKKNIMANENESNPNRGCEGNAPENKENLLTEKPLKSKLPLSSSLEKGTKEVEFTTTSQDSYKNKLESNSKLKVKKESKNSPEVSDDVPCKILTSKLLKEHGDCIDRNLIQEKYFQSQLLEIEKKQMTSKSTSMETPFDQIEYNQVHDKTTATVACQYSSRLNEETSDESSKIQDLSVIVMPNKDSQQDTSDHYGSIQNLFDEDQMDTSKDTNRDADLATGDSLPSSTQTAHSWVPAMQESGQYRKSGVGRARSFEYLPGHIYESSGNLREKLPSENEHVLSDSSSDSSEAKSTNQSNSGGSEHSEGRNTLVLENSNEVSCESGRLKSLDDNLAQLNIVVAKLREKDADVQKITQSLLVNFWKQNGSGDCPDNLVVIDPQKTGLIDYKESLMAKNSSQENYDGWPEGEFQLAKNVNKENDISVACQTEDKSPKSNFEKFYEERRSLESRLAADKETQIKWIEKEIYHLNVLRELLEKQSSLSHREKKLSNSPASHKSVENEKNQLKALAEVYPRPVTPVYGCTISLLDDKSPKTNNSTLEEELSSLRRENNETMSPNVDNTKYGMALSLNGNLRKVVLLPVGVQVSLNQPELFEESLKNSSILCENAKSPSFALQSPRSQSLDRKLQRRPCKLSGRYQTDVTTQYPSVKRATKNRPSTSAVADLQSPKKCCLCLQKNCVCLNFSQSEKSYSTMSRCSKNHHKSGERKSSARDYVDNSGHKVTSDFGRADAINPSSILKTCQKNFDNQHITSDSATDCTKDKFLTFCRCENCPKRSFKVKKPCQNACSKVYLSCEKLADEKCEQCRCSNVQIQKSSTCACHVIKIHSPTCCTTENGRCSCKKQCVAKNRENQYCQTNEVVIETKEVVTNSGSVKSTKASRSVYPCEEKVGETTNLAKERFSSTSKLCCEKRQQCHTKMEFNERNTLRNKNSAVNASSIHKSPSRRCCCCCCCCKKKEKKEDDHPRHYFLKIEETEVGENNESVERRRSLEVITVKVPVKKAGKAKIYGNDFRQINEEKHCEIESYEVKPTGGCKCCECLRKSRKEELTEGYETHWKEEECRKIKAKKQEPFKKNSKSFRRLAESDSSEGIDICSEEVGYKDPCNTLRQSGSSKNGYPESSADYKMSQAYFKLNGLVNTRSRSSSKEERKISSRETPSDYNNYVDYRSADTYHSKDRYQLPCRDEERRKLSPCGRCCKPRLQLDERKESKSSPTRKCLQGGDPYISDYYNYDKREYMTKSELLKEERRKKKVHQPSLQEYLESNRPDFCSSAESRRRIISERAKERIKNHENRIDCLLKLMQQCNKTKRSKISGPKRIFTTSQMREQTMKKYRKLPEVTGKVADQKKKEEYRTNKLMADIFAKKLQLETLKGHINLSNSVSILSTI